MKSQRAKSDSYKYLLLFTKYFTFAVLTFLAFSWIPLNNEIQNNSEKIYLEEVNLSPCEETVFNAVTYFEQNGAKYIIQRNSNLDISTNIRNVKCINKVTSIDKVNDIYVINISTSTNFNYLVIFLIVIYFSLIFKKQNYWQYTIYGICSLFYLHSNFFIQSFVHKILDLFILFLIFLIFTDRKNKILKFIIIFLTYISWFRLFQYNFLIEDELFYMGYQFKAQGQYSAFYVQDALIYYDQIIKFSIQLFNNYFHVVLKSFQALSFCFIIFLFTNLFKLKTYASILILPIFFKFQSAIASSWIIENFTSSGVAHLFILTAVYFAFKNNLIITTSLLVASTYLHFPSVLIISPLFIFLYFKKEKLKIIFYHAIIFFLATITHFYSQFINNNESNTLFDGQTLEIYIKYRHPHHLLPFPNSDLGFVYGMAQGFRVGFLSIILLTVFLLVFRQLVNEEAKLLVEFTIFSNLVLIFYFLILYFFSISIFAVLFPLRLSSYCILFNSLSLFKIAENKLYPYGDTLKLTSGILIALMVIPLNYQYSNSITGLEKNNTVSIDLSSYPDREELLRSVKLLEEGSILLTPPHGSGENTFFRIVEITTGYQTYVNWKFIPHNLEKVQDWKLKLTQLQNFYNGDCNSIDELESFYFITTLEFSGVENCGKLLFKNNTFQLFKNIHSS